MDMVLLDPAMRAFVHSDNRTVGILVLLALVVCLFEALAQNAEAEILSQTLTIRSTVLPAGTEVVRDTDGDVTEAVLHSPSSWQGVSLPTSSRIIYFKNQIFALLPSAPSATINGRELAATVETLEWNAPVPNTDMECRSPNGSWLIERSGPASTPFRPLTLASIVPSVQGVQSHVHTLNAAVRSDDLDLAVGTIVISDDQGNVSHLYLAGDRSRLGNFVLSKGSLVDLGPYWRTVYTQDELTVGNLVVAAGGSFGFDGDGNVAYATLGQDVSILDGFVVPAGSTIGFSASRLFDVILAKDTTYRGIALGAGHAACFAFDGSANLLLKESTTTDGKTFPAGSNVVLSPQGQVESAFLSGPGTFDGFTIWKPSYPVVSFNGTGHFRSGFLQTTAQVGGFSVKSYLLLYDDGKIESANLNGDQTINGIPCAGDQEVDFDNAGRPTTCTLSADYTLGPNHLHHGQRFSNRFNQTVSANFTILQPQDLANLLGGIANQVTDSGKAQLMKNSSKFPFGNIGNITPHDFRWSPSLDHIDVHEELSVQNMLTNPPFADCDSNVVIDATISWTIAKVFPGKIVAAAWVSKLGGGFSHNFCPGTSVLEAVAAVGRVFGLIHDDLSGPLASAAQSHSVQKNFGPATEQKIEAFLQQLYTGATVVNGSFSPDRLYIENQQLKLAYHYEIVQDLWSGNGGN
jgi:hypothetical protein